MDWSTYDVRKKWIGPPTMLGGYKFVHLQCLIDIQHLKVWMYFYRGNFFNLCCQLVTYFCDQKPCAVLCPSGSE